VWHRTRFGKPADPAVALAIPHAASPPCSRSLRPANPDRSYERATIEPWVRAAKRSPLLFTL